MKPIKIDSKVYRLGEYVAAKTDQGDWKLGQPIYPDEPERLLFIEYTTSYHRRLIDAVNCVRRKERLGRMIRQAVGT